MDERSTFGSLLEPLIPNLRRYARALTRDAVRAEDLLQDTLERAFDKQHLFEPGDMMGWLGTMMFRLNIVHVRKHARAGLPLLPFDAAGLIEDTPAKDDPSMALVIRDLKRGLMLLPEGQRRALLLVGCEGLSYEEAAAAEGVPVGTIRSRVCRGRGALASLMDGGPPPLRRGQRRATQ